MPDVPLHLATVSQNKAHVTFSWDAPSDDGGSPIRDYEVFGDGSDANLDPEDFVQLASTTFLTLQHSETDVSAGTVYRFTVKARNDAGLGEASLPISIQAATPPGAPDSPTLALQNE